MPQEIWARQALPSGLDVIFCTCFAISARTILGSSFSMPRGPQGGRGCVRTVARALEHPWNKTLSLGDDFQQFPGVEAIESTVSGRWESNPRPKIGKAVARP